MERSVRERIVRTCDPETIEAALDALWRELADRTPAARAVMSNLVVFQDPAADEEEIAGATADVAKHHPSRIIVLIHHDNPAQRRGPAGASVGILLFGPEGRRHGVEHITIRSVCAQEGVPSIVRRLILGDLPTSVWWMGDLSQTPPSAALVALGRQFVFDSRQWRDVGAGLSTMAALLGSARPPDLVDVNWRSLAPLRQALARHLRSRSAAIGASSVRVQVRHQPRDAASAWLLVGWMGSRLGPLRQRDLVLTVDRREAAAQLLSIVIDYGDGSSLSTELDGSRVTIKDTPAADTLSLQVPLESAAEAVAAELGTLGRDLVFDDAIREAHQRFISEA